MNRKKLSFLVAILFFAVIHSFAQENDRKRTSPLAVVSMKYKDAYVKITYSQPQKRGREIFGKLVPFGQVWNMGANEATEITTTKNILINGFLLKAGTYSLFTIPQKEKWTIIINNELGLWGAYNYNSKLDEMRFDIVVETLTGEIYEDFTMHLDQRNEVADLNMIWDKTKVSIPIKFIN
jgi:Protein of unknown function (DUF2911)